MKITGIKRSATIPDLFAVYIDNKFSFNIHRNSLNEYTLHINKTLTEHELKKMQLLSLEDKAYGLAVRFAMIRPRSTWEVQSYLKRKKISPSTSINILNKLRKINALDDSAFAKAWIRSKQLHRPVSKLKLQQELRSKRISDDIIDDVIKSEEFDEYTSLKELLSKKRVHYPDKLKLMQYLMRQGFRYEDVKRAIQNESD